MVRPAGPGRRTSRVPFEIGGFADDGGGGGGVGACEHSTPMSFANSGSRVIDHTGARHVGHDARTAIHDS